MAAGSRPPGHSSRARICARDGPGHAETRETRSKLDGDRPQPIGRGHRDHRRQDETPDTSVVLLITQRSQVQILPPLPARTARENTSGCFFFVRFAGRRTIRVVHASRYGPHSPSPGGLPKYAAPPRPAAVVDERHRSTPYLSMRSTDSPCLGDTCKARPAFGFPEPYLKISRIYQVFFRCHNESRWLLHILARV